jgi:hypothetical protein
MLRLVSWLSGMHWQDIAHPLPEMFRFLGIIVLSRMSVAILAQSTRLVPGNHGSHVWSRQGHQLLRHPVSAQATFLVSEGIASILILYAASWELNLLKPESNLG